MQISFFIPKKAKSLNTLMRQHFHQRAAEKKVWGNLIFEQWMKHNRYVFTKPVKVLYLISNPTRCLRDKDKFIGGAKELITDFLKKTFFTRDDAQWLQKIDVEFVKGNEGVRIIIEEVVDE